MERRCTQQARKMERSYRRNSEYQPSSNPSAAAANPAGWQHPDAEACPGVAEPALTLGAERLGHQVIGAAVLSCQVEL